MQTDEVSPMSPNTPVSKDSGLSHRRAADGKVVISHLRQRQCDPRGRNCVESVELCLVVSRIAMYFLKEKGSPLQKFEMQEAHSHTEQQRSAKVIIVCSGAGTKLRC